MEKMMKNGTLPDKMAAYIVRIQDSPTHNLNYLHSLIGMVKIQGKQQCLVTAGTITILHSLIVILFTPEFANKVP
jgi:hypothetical protein